MTKLGQKYCNSKPIDYLNLKNLWSENYYRKFNPCFSDKELKYLLKK